MTPQEFTQALEAAGYTLNGTVYEKQGPEYWHRFEVEGPMATYTTSTDPPFNMAFNLASFHPDEISWVENILSQYLSFS